MAQLLQVPYLLICNLSYFSFLIQIGDTALVYAIRQGDLSVVKALNDNGYYVNERDANGTNFS